MRGRQYTGAPRPTTMQPQPQPYGGGGYGYNNGGDGGYVEGSFGNDQGVGEPIERGYEGEEEEEEMPQEFSKVGNGRPLVDLASNAISQCPVENGVMRTTWGAVSAGPLLAGTDLSTLSQMLSNSVD